MLAVRGVHQARATARLPELVRRRGVRDPPRPPASRQSRNRQQGQAHMSEDRNVPRTTTDSGVPIPSDEHSLTVGPDGPTVLQDHYLVQKLQHFNRERVPERVVHAKGSGAHGFFEVTEDVTQFTKAAFLSEIGKRTPVFLRFSTVAGEMGSADTVRDPRGFAMKFYTE